MNDLFFDLEEQVASNEDSGTKPRIAGVFALFLSTTRNTERAKPLACCLHGYPVQQMGVLEIPEGHIKPTGIKPTVGKLCKKCGNATLIKKDGGEFCTSCGAIGACG